MSFIPSDVNIERMSYELDTLSRYGTLPQGGITRLTYTPAHQQAVQQVAGWMEQAGLEVSFDRWGNLFGRLRGTIESDKTAYSGSHLDSVPCGGNYDGPLGVIASLEAIRMIRARDLRLKRDIELVAFIEEEGSRFHMHLGSMLALGMISEEALETLTDADGLQMLEVLKQLRFPYPVREHNLRETAQSYIELHIEQGKRLEKAGKPVGVVTHFAGPKYYRVTINGRADHAGTTEYADRHDALLAASWLILECGWLAREKYIHEARITVGQLQAEPGAANVVAGKVTLTIDTRASSERISQAIEGDIRNLLDTAAGKFGVSIQIEVVLDISPVGVEEGMVGILHAASKQAGVAHMDLISWAAHDAQEAAQFAPAGMLFVPCREGRSHCPQEFAREEDIAVGTAVLANALISLAS